jgi:5'-methylthioadenosine phosphorylase
VIGLIGGTGLYRLEGLEIEGRRAVNTPFGAPSDDLVFGRVGAHDVVFLPRHGATHHLLPMEINYRANVWALKHVGARAVVSVTAVGSLREPIAPGQFAVPSQYIDMAIGGRKKTFFGEGVAAHISTAQTAHPQLSERLCRAAQGAGATVHGDVTYVCVEGPRLGTVAESHLWRTAGADVVGMTQVPEAFLAKEAQLAHATLSVVTDYDCWRPQGHVTLAAVFEQYARSIETVRATLFALLSEPWSLERDLHLEGAIMTPRSAWPAHKLPMMETLLS